jgi:hypothetical protein
LDFTGFEFPHTAIRERGESLVNPCLIFQVGVDENVVVCGVPPYPAARMEKPPTTINFAP